MLPTTFLITLQQPIACILLSAQHLVFHLHTYQGSPQIGPASGRERPACLGLGIKGASSLFPNLVHPALYHKAFRIGYLFHPLSSKKNSDVIESWTWLSWMSKVHFPLGGILSGSLWVSPRNAKQGQENSIWWRAEIYGNSIKTEGSQSTSLSWRYLRVAALAWWHEGMKFRGEERDGAKAVWETRLDIHFEQHHYRWDLGHILEPLASRRH